MSEGRRAQVRSAFKRYVDRHPLWNTWASMVKRCNNPSHKSWLHYGGRGIAVDPSWRQFRTFEAWVEANLGPRPAGMTLDRIDVDGNYEPGNVRWASSELQARNRRAKVFTA